MIHAAISLSTLRPAGATRRLAAAWMAGLCCLAGSLAAAAPGITPEYQVKAAFLYNFTKFIEWPPAAFADATSPIVIGVAGENPFGDELEKIVRDRKVNGRPIRIVAVPAADVDERLHVVFIPADAERAFEKHIESLTRRGVLVVGESVRFLALGGTVQFTAEDRVRFEISVAAASRGGLKISAQLQKLAVAVRH